MSKKNKVIYQLTMEDINTVATEIIGRELSAGEIKKLIDPIAESVPWFEIIENNIREYLELEEVEEELA